MMDRVFSTTRRGRSALLSAALPYPGLAARGNALALGAQLCILGWSLLAAGSAGAQVLTLEEIETKAQRDRSELVERQASIEKAQAELGLAQSRTGPTLGARVEGALAPGGELLKIPYDDQIYRVSGAKELGEADSFLPRARYAAVLSACVRNDATRDVDGYVDPLPSGECGRGEDGVG